MKLQKLAFALLSLTTIVMAIICINEELRLIASPDRMRIPGHSIHLGVLIVLNVTSLVLMNRFSGQAAAQAERQAMRV